MLVIGDVANKPPYILNKSTVYTLNIIIILKYSIMFFMIYELLSSMY